MVKKGFVRIQIVPGHAIAKALLVLRPSDQPL